MRFYFTLPLVLAALSGCIQPVTPTTARVPAETRAPGDNLAPGEHVRTVRKPTEPDNTAVNQRDADANTKTPIDQKENQPDLNLTAKIRRAVLEVQDLSIDARNAKIITADGKVTLRGPVKSTEERDTLNRIAVDAAGEGNVDNQLEVATATTTDTRR